MPFPACRLRVCVSIVILSLAYAGTTTADEVRYDTISRKIIESRLGRYAGDNKQREIALKEMFAESGCDDQHLSEQPVKGSKLPNVICLLPGKSENVIIVGAHFDHVSLGDGVVDNWSGASLLPSLYETVKNEARRHTYVFIGFTDEERDRECLTSDRYALDCANPSVSRTRLEGFPRSTDSGRFLLPASAKSVAPGG